MAFQQNAFQHNAFQTGVAGGTASAALDGGDEAGWLSLPGVIAGAVLVAGAIASGNARAAAVNHQDEIPYVTGNGVSYSQPYTSRAQVKPVFIQMGGGDELPVSAAPSFVDDTTDPVAFPKIEIPLPAPVWDDPQIARILVEENEWVSPLIVPQIVVAPTFGHQDEYPITVAPSFPPSEEDWNFRHLSKDSVDGIIWVTDDDIAPAFAVEEIGWKAEWLIPQPFTQVFWEQEDPLPIAATPLGIDEEPWKPPTLSLEGPKWLDSPNEEIVPQPAPAIRDEEPFLGASYPLGPVVQVSDHSDDIVPQPPTEINVEETYWLQPDPPRDVVTGWQFPLDINEDFPELSTPPTPPRVEILGGDPVKKRKKSPREEIRDLLNEPSREKVVLAPPTPELPKPLQPVAKVVPAEYLPPIGVLPVSEPPPPAFSDEEMAEILALIHLGIL